MLNVQCRSKKPGETKAQWLLRAFKKTVEQNPKYAGAKRILNPIMPDGEPNFFRETLAENSGLVAQIKRQFELVIPEMYRKQKRLASTPVVAKPAQGEGCEGGETCQPQDEAHFTLGETQSFTGERKRCTGLRLGKPLHDPRDPDDKNDASV